MPKFLYTVWFQDQNLDDIDVEVLNYVEKMSQNSYDSDITGMRDLISKPDAAHWLADRIRLIKQGAENLEKITWLKQQVKTVELDAFDKDYSEKKTGGINAMLNAGKRHNHALQELVNFYATTQA